MEDEFWPQLKGGIDRFLSEMNQLWQLRDEAWQLSTGSGAVEPVGDATEEFLGRFWDILKEITALEGDGIRDFQDKADGLLAKATDDVATMFHEIAEDVIKDLRKRIEQKSRGLLFFGNLREASKQLRLAEQAFNQAAAMKDGGDARKSIDTYRDSIEKSREGVQEVVAVGLGGRGNQIMILLTLTALVVAAISLVVAFVR